LGVSLDHNKNQQGVVGTVTEIQDFASKVKVLIIPTNEELEIAEQTMTLIQAT
jgi:acetate kinase